MYHDPAEREREIPAVLHAGRGGVEADAADAGVAAVGVLLVGDEADDARALRDVRRLDEHKVLVPARRELERLDLLQARRALAAEDVHLFRLVRAPVRLDVHELRAAEGASLLLELELDVVRAAPAALVVRPARGERAVGVAAVAGGGRLDVFARDEDGLGDERARGVELLHRLPERGERLVRHLKPVLEVDPREVALLSGGAERGGARLRRLGCLGVAFAARRRLSAPSRREFFQHRSAVRLRHEEVVLEPLFERVGRTLRLRARRSLGPLVLLGESGAQPFRAFGARRYRVRRGRALARLHLLERVHNRLDRRVRCGLARARLGLLRRNDVDEELRDFGALLGRGPEAVREDEEVGDRHLLPPVRRRHHA
mmetsp:Transcript_14230/g.46720  ORF Transcript_14230/g.46720 Transcript_14230/m.46720 type:complete len:372 (+) Transcript_14230:30-1145(+)